MLFLSISCFSQESYFGNGRIWTILDRSGDMDTIYITHYSIDNKLDLDGKIYYNIENYLLRQDGYKIYLRDILMDTVDFLLYDFSLQVGDSIGNPLGEYAKVITRDEFILGDGRKAVRLDYIGRSSDIEYIGNVNTGLIGYYESFILGCYDVKLLCCAENEMTLFEQYEGACEGEPITSIPVINKSETPTTKKYLDRYHLYIKGAGSPVYNALGGRVE